MSVYEKYEAEFDRFITESGFAIETTNFYLGDCFQHKDYRNLYISYISFAYKYGKTHYIVTLYNEETNMTFRVEATDWIIFLSELKAKLNLYFTKS